jgi:hypothetical protein
MDTRKGGTLRNMKGFVTYQEKRLHLLHDEQRGRSRWKRSQIGVRAHIAYFLHSAVRHSYYKATYYFKLLAYLTALTLFCMNDVFRSVMLRMSYSVRMIEYVARSAIWKVHGRTCRDKFEASKFKEIFKNPHSLHDATMCDVFTVHCPPHALVKSLSRR